jgi:hypothetical protein
MSAERGTSPENRQSLAGVANRFERRADGAMRSEPLGWRGNAPVREDGAGTGPAANSGQARCRDVAVRDATARANREADRKYPDTKERRSHAQKRGETQATLKLYLKIKKKGADEMRSNTALAATEPRRESRTIMRRIGSTDFEIAVYFSATNKETLNDKIKRLIKSEAGKGVKKQ